MNRLEEYIRSHKSLFDEEPAAGHYERLQEKLECRDDARNVSAKPIYRAFSIAASIAIIVAAGALWQNNAKPANTLVCENVSDMKFCYLDRMDDIASRIETLTKDFDPWSQQEIMNDVQNIIDAANSGFESEIPEELPDDAAKAILSDYYRQNLESLEMIVQTINH